MTSPSAFDANAFCGLGRAVLDQLAEHLERCSQRALPVLQPAPPASLLESYSQPFPEAPSSDSRFAELLAEILRHSNHLHHPGYMGHQVSVPLPSAAIAEMASALFNNGMAIFEMGQIQTVMERRVVDFLCESVGFGANAGGVLTHGGSLGNLTALLAARQAKAGYDVWTEGQREPMAVLVSQEAHYCVARAVQAMGWGRGGAVPVKTDHRHSMLPSDLPRALEEARARGRQVIAVVASACSTSTGSFDPIPPLADFCEQHDLWLHVDGAHGAPFTLSATHRHLVQGVGRANSVVWDLHKMMSLPALNTAVLFREERDSYAAFAQKADYLFDATPPEEQWFNVGQRTMECTKRAMGVTAYLMLETLGTDWFGTHVDALMERTGWLVAALESATDFELATPPQANIVCFRHRPKGMPDGELDAHQVRLRQETLARGGHYIVQTRLGEGTWLRVTMMNPMTSNGDIQGLLETLRTSAKRGLC